MENNSNKSVEYQNIKDDLLNDIYANNPNYDENEIMQYIEWEIRKCLEEFEEIAPKIDNIVNYIKIFGKEDFME
jgi:hypothetical protein